jgi:hypothetical protein
MGKIVNYIAGKRYGTDQIKEDLTDDIKLIVSDLKEHIEVQESQELKMIKENFRKVIDIIDVEKHKDIEVILENLISSKSSKKDALQDFTDKIVTTIEELEEKKEEPVLLGEDGHQDQEFDKELNHSSRMKKRLSTNSINSPYSMSNRKSIDTRTKFSEFNLSSGQQHKGARKINHYAGTIIEKLKQKKFLRDVMPKSQLFMLITQIHKMAVDYLEKSPVELPLCGYVYDYIMNKYGIKKIADKKFRQL